MAKHKDRPLVNAKEGTHSTITLVDVGFDLRGYVVKPHTPVTDMSTMQKGEWTAKRIGDQKDELRLLLTCKKSPKNRDKFGDPPDGTLTITLTNSGTDKQVMTTVDYVNDDPPP